MVLAVFLVLFFVSASVSAAALNNDTAELDGKIEISLECRLYIITKATYETMDKIRNLFQQ